MLQSRSYQVRGKPVDVVEVPGVLAVRGATRKSKESKDRDTQIDAAVVTAGVPLQTLQTFRDAGWKFVAADHAPDDAVKLFVKRGGRLTLGTNRLTVQLKGNPEPDDAEAMLNQMGTPVVGLERLKMAPGLYQVQVDPSADQDVLADSRGSARRRQLGAH